MKNTMHLEHNGLVQITRREMKTTNGGIFRYILTAIILDAFLNPEGSLKAFKAGYAAGSQ